MNGMHRHEKSVCNGMFRNKLKIEKMLFSDLIQLTDIFKFSEQLCAVSTRVYDSVTSPSTS